MITRSSVHKIEGELKQLEEKRTALTHELEQAEARLAQAQAKAPGLAELETKVFLGEASDGDVDRVRQALDREAQAAQGELDRLRRVGPELDRRLAAGREALRRARLDEARLVLAKASAAQVKAAEAVRDALAQAATTAAELEKRRADAGKATAAAEALLAAGETLDAGPDEPDFTQGMEGLLSVMTRGPVQPSRVAAAKETTRRRQDAESLSWAATASKSGLTPWAQIGCQLPEHLHEQARQKFDELAEERKRRRQENDSIRERDRGFDHRRAV